MLGLLLIALQSPGGALGIGDTAPPLAVGGWLRGEPVTGFQKGTVYVVDFWATWCGPCRLSVPHLSALQRRYAGRVEVIGVSIREEGGDTAAYVRELGNAVAYRMAEDGARRTMERTWADAAGEAGLPCAFVVDGAGRVVWIGDPMLVAGPLEEVVAGRFDWKAFGAKRSRTKEAEQAEVAIRTKMLRLLEEKKYEEVVTVLSNGIRNYPELSVRLGLEKFSALLAHDEATAYRYARENVSKDFKDDATALTALAWEILGAELKRPDYPLALWLAERARKKAGDGDVLSSAAYAYALFKVGRVEEAIAVQQKIVDGLDGTAPPKLAQSMRDRLKLFKGSETVVAG
jgi:thiol-disulfide isomerase/thioredoxin